MAYYAEKLANTPRERAAIKKLQKSTYTRSRTRREAVGTSFLNLHPNANAKVYNAFTEIFGLKESEVISIMRKNLKPPSFRLWRKRVSGRKTKHQAKRNFQLGRFKCSRQRNINQNKISKRNGSKRN